MTRPPCHSSGRLGLICASVAVLVMAVSGCRPGAKATPQTGSTAAPASPSAPAQVVSELPTPLFTDITTKSGIDWTHNPCRTGKKLLPETVGGGGGFIDYNNDGKLDILLINGAALPGYKGVPGKLALYRNNGDGTFTDVTKKSGLDFHGYGFGAAVGDYDNDGWPDLYITALDGNKLYHNDHGHFRDVTASSGLGVNAFCTAATWIDYNRDGKLDLFVGSYVEWTAATDLPCGAPNARQYCAPNQYKGARPHLFRNRGNGSFEDVTDKAGLHNLPGKTLGVTVYDFNNDGWPDIVIADDTVANVLLINNRDGTFTDQALTAGVALGDDGLATGSMGIDVGTPFNDGKPGIAIATFAAQEMSLFMSANPLDSSSPPLFDNKKRESGIAAATRSMTTFGLEYADVDLDGWPDLILVNGHIDNDPDMKVGTEHIPYQQPAQLFQNQHDGTFKDVAPAAGLSTPVVGRGLAIGDIDNDGRPDLLIFENGGKVRLFHNDTKTTGGWLGVKLIGTSSPRDGTGAMVQIVGKGINQIKCATAARSYLSINDPRVLFGLGKNIVDKLVVKWPSGKVTTVPSPHTNTYLTVTEP